MNIPRNNQPVRPRRRFDLRLRSHVAFCLWCGLVLLVAGDARAQNEGASPAVPSDNIEDHADLGHADSPRRAEDLARDAGEKPAAIAAFAAVAPRKRVADLRARDGYLTEVLALAAYPYGKVFANNDPGSLSNADAGAWNARLDKPELADIARFDLPLGSPLPPYALGLDVVVSAGAYADAIRRNLDRKAMNTAVLSALHPGGLYVIADARAAAGGPEGAALCRSSEKQVREEVEAAGFRFVEAGQALSDTADAHTSSACQTSPGRSLDRFLLKFEKPAPEPAQPSK